MGEIDQMRLFARAVEAGSFSGAGRQVGVAPSSVSRQISELEASLGARLFNRTTRQLSLTEAGEVYYDRVQRILDDVENAKLAIGEIEGRPAGLVRVTAPSGIGRELLATILPDFLNQYPSIRIVFSMTDREIDIVGAGIDVAIRLGRLPDSTLKARKIGESKRRVCASPAYLKRLGVPKTPEDLADHNCLTWRAHPGANLWRFRGTEGAAAVRASGNLFAQNADVLVAAASAGLGVVLLPDWNMSVELASGALTEILTDYEAQPAASPIYAVFPPQAAPPLKVRAFVDFIAKHLAGAPKVKKRRS